MYLPPGSLDLAATNTDIILIGSDIVETRSAVIVEMRREHPNRCKFTNLKNGSILTKVVDFHVG